MTTQELIPREPVKTELSVKNEPIPRKSNQNFLRIQSSNPLIKPQTKLVTETHN